VSVTGPMRENLVTMDYFRAVTDFGLVQGETLRREQLVDLFRSSLYHLVFFVPHL
jgi:hypothetical protein